MVKYNNFWLGSITHKDLVVFVDEHLGRSEYLSHLITADVITHKETLTLYYETPYGDGAELTFDAYGFENRLDLISYSLSSYSDILLNIHLLSLTLFFISPIIFSFNLSFCNYI